MFNHQPQNYVCPFCELLAGDESEHNSQNDIVFQNKFVTATISPKWWGINKGHVIVVPNTHYENIYDTPDDILGEVYKVVKKISIAMRTTYGCEGISTRQHNEPAGNQDVWHLHVHVFPRYEGDRLYQNQDDKDFFSSDERAPYAEKLRAYLAAN
jgi:histidine triad (HIT) family protein